MKILVTASRFPYPLEKGDKLRLYHQLRLLSQYHEITLCALTDKPVTRRDRAALSAYCARIEVLPLSAGRHLANLARVLTGRMPLQVSYFYERRWVDRVAAIAREVQPDVIYTQLVRTTEYTRHLPYPALLDYMDAFSVGMARRAEQASPGMRTLWRHEQRLLRAYERAVYNDYEQHTIISEQDRMLLDLPQSVAVIPNGVDVDYFSPQHEVATAYDLGFVGNMSYRPNVIAAEHLAQDILPRLTADRGLTTLLLAGASPALPVRQLGSDTVTVSGWMDDIRQAYASARVFVAPLYTGSGLQNKILEAMAMGIPCVTTSLVNNAVQAPPDAIATADDTHSFVASTRALLTDERQYERQRATALDFVRRNYHWEAIVDRLNAQLQQTATHTHAQHDRRSS